MPQATEKARNGPDQRLATNGLATPHDDARESFASGGSGPSRGLEFAPPPHDGLILPALRDCGPFENARFAGLHNRGPLQRGIGPPLEAQRLDASGGWTSHQVLRAPDAHHGWARPQTPSTTSRTRRRWPGCISLGPIAQAASDRVGLERPRSAARDLRRTTPPDFIASLLHRLVRARDLLRRLDRLVRRFFRGLGRYLGTHGHDFGHQTHHGLLGQLH
jgi:hypothetical protein